MAKIKVTIGVCVKNAENAIREAIRSIIDQNFSHEQMELIVVDGYSKDKTLLIIKEHIVETDIKTRVFYESEGLGAARQIVVDNIEGDYIIWVDSDMWLPSDYVKNMVEFMDQHSNVGIAGGKYGLSPGRTLASALENICYVVDSVYGEKSASNLGYLPGTEGSIFRVKAIRQVGGFDKNIRGAAEDTELVYRIKKDGWSVCVTKEVFKEYCRETWKELWDQYFWYGYGGHFLFHKDKGMITLYKMLPITGFLAGLLRSFAAYEITCAKKVFTLPLAYFFKRIAWWAGFIKGHIEGYGHRLNK